MRLLFTANAARDLDGIYAYVRADRPMAASGILERVRTSSDRLRHHPYIGRTGSVAGTRELVVRGLPYIIYRVDDVSDVVTILNVVHGARRRSRS